MSEPIKVETIKENGMTNAFYFVVVGAGRFERIVFLVDFFFLDDISVGA